MIIKQIKIENFRSFLGTHEVVFQQNSLTVIQGQNLDTQGESASGKSSLLLAISYGLDICPFSGKDLQNWNTEDPMQITLTLSFNNEEIVVKRGKVNSITLLDRTITGSKDIEAYLQTMTGLTHEQLSFVIYKEQGGNDYFLEKTNSDKRDFLASVLNLEEYELEISKSNEKCNDLNTKLIQYKSALDVYHKQKQDIHKEEDKLKLIKINEPLNVDYLKEAISVWMVELAKEETLFTSIQSEMHKEQIKFKTLLSELEKTFNQEDTTCREIKININRSQEERLRLSAIKSTTSVNIKELESQVKNLDKTLSILEKTDHDLAQQKELRTALLKGECPTCEQSWISKDTLNKTKELIETLIKKREELNNKVLELPLLENKVNELNIFYTKTDAGIANQFDLEVKLNKELSILLKNKNDDYIEACKKISKEQAEIETPLTLMRSKIDALNYKIKKAQIQIAEIDKQNVDINNKIAQIETTQSLLDE